MVVAIMSMLSYVAIFKPNIKSVAKGSLIFAAACFLMFFLALLQLLPTFELLNMSTRQMAVHFEFYTVLSGWQKSAPYLINIIFFPLAFASVTYAILKAKDDKWLLLLLVVTCLCIMISTNTFQILRIVSLIPVLKRLFWHEYMLLIATILVGVMAGESIHSIGYEDKENFRWKHFLLLLILAWLISIGYQTFVLLSKGEAGQKDGLILLLNIIGWATVILLFSYNLISKNEFLSKTAFHCLILIIVVSTYGSSLGKMFFDRYNAMNFNHSYIEFISRLPSTCRNINIYNNTYYRGADDNLTVPYQAGAIYEGQTFDFYISVIPTWNNDFFNMIIPLQEVESVMKRGNPAWLFHRFKRSEFIRQKNLKYLNVMNLCTVVSDHENFKFSSHYNLVYSVRPESCKPAICKLDDALESEFDKPLIRMPAGSSLAHQVYVKDNNKLRLGIARDTLRSTSDSLSFSVSARKIKSKEKILIFEKALTKRQSDRPLYFNIDLEQLKGKTWELQFAVLAERDADGNKGRGLWIDPVIINENAVFKRIKKDKDVQFYTNKDVLPRAMILHDYRVLPNKKSRLDFISSDRYDPSRIVVLEKAPSLQKSFHYRTRREMAKVTGYIHDRVTIKTRLSTPGILFLSDTYFPGWKVYVNGNERRILKANHAFRGVALPAGSHMVEFRYEPFSVRMGLYVTLLSVLLILGLAMAINLKSKTS